MQTIFVPIKAIWLHAEILRLKMVTYVCCSWFLSRSNLLGRVSIEAKVVIAFVRVEIFSATPGCGFLPTLS